MDITAASVGYRPRVPSVDNHQHMQGSDCASSQGIGRQTQEQSRIYGICSFAQLCGDSLTDMSGYAFIISTSLDCFN
jgi:hypothetical protein